MLTCYITYVADPIMDDSEELRDAERHAFILKVWIILQTGCTLESKKRHYFVLL